MKQVAGEWVLDVCKNCQADLKCCAVWAHVVACGWGVCELHNVSTGPLQGCAGILVTLALPRLCKCSQGA